MPDERPSPWLVTLKLGARVRARGPWEVLRLGGERLRDLVSSEDVLILFARPTSHRPPLNDRPPGATERWATGADGPQYARDVGTDSAQSFRARLSETTRCFLILKDDLIVHASWVTTTAAWTRELRSHFRPPPGDAYVFESFTRPEVRGQGVYPYALAGISDHLETEGIMRVWVGVEADNPSSAKAVKKAGFEPGFEIPFGRRWGRLWVGPATGPLAEACQGCLEG